MKKIAKQSLIYSIFLFGIFLLPAYSLTKEELAQRFKPLPTVAEKDLPPLKNKREPFKGKIEKEGFEGYTWVQFPFLENPGSFGIDPKGRIYAAEANRFWLGVPDLRGANELIPGDFMAKSVEDRAKLYETFKDKFPEGWFSAVADRVVLLEDRDGNGAADHRSLYSDHFNKPLDGIGFSVLAEDDAVYFTNIPNVWKMKDQNDDGKADSHEAIATGFGVRVSFIGHDLHGVTRGPDGRLYFSIGDRGYNIKTKEGKHFVGSGRGAIFRCESDGSNFERFCDGLRNPQELAFDEYGNLFTFDNTGDIGDKARMVYALEGSDSGWDMSHQSPHHYRHVLDWKNFHPSLSMWVAEKMFDTYSEEQPQWVYPPASHVARGPSGVTYLSGDTLPPELQNKFLLANYRGAAVNCTVLLIGKEPKGAGYVATSEEVFVKGVGASDVEHGYDGKIYLCDFGGGWSINTKGSIQAIEPKDAKLKKRGAEIASWFKKDLSKEPEHVLIKLILSSDKRLRQRVQFALVEQGSKGVKVLSQIANNASIDVRSRLHGVWGLGQLGRQGHKTASVLIELLKDVHPEVVANAARTLGSMNAHAAKGALIKSLSHANPRVVSLSAIALSRVVKPGDEEAFQKLIEIAQTQKSFDPVIRHAFLTALDRIATESQNQSIAKHANEEVRLLSLLTMRRHHSPNLVTFLKDRSSLIQKEAVRAIYDTPVLDGKAGEVLAQQIELGESMSKTLQRRILAANYRKGKKENAIHAMMIASNAKYDLEIRQAAFYALDLWTHSLNTDPVLGHYRPQLNTKSVADLKGTLSQSIQDFLSQSQDAKLMALCLKLADKIKLKLDANTLMAQIKNEKLDVQLRAAAMDSLISLKGKDELKTVLELLDHKLAPLQAVAIKHAFQLNHPKAPNKGLSFIKAGNIEPARASIEGLSKANVDELKSLWANKQNLKAELHLDLYLALKNSTQADAQSLIAGLAPKEIHQLSIYGGDVSKGEQVFRNQGACMQCHKVGREGGIQGPSLTTVAQRLKPAKLLESLTEPGAEIAKGYGQSTISMKDGSVLMGRIANRQKDKLSFVSMTGEKKELKVMDIQNETPPTSAMPPLGLALKPSDLRDLVAYLASLTKNTAKKPKGH